MPGTRFFDDDLQHLVASRIHFRNGLGWKQLHARRDETARCDARFQHAKAFAAARHEVEQTELWHIPLRDRGQATDALRNGRAADFGAFADEAHPEWNIVAQTQLRHFEVALLEDLERQYPLRKEHRVEREDMNVPHRGVSHSLVEPCL